MTLANREANNTKVTRSSRNGQVAQPKILQPAMKKVHSINNISADRKPTLAAGAQPQANASGVKVDNTSVRKSSRIKSQKQAIKGPDVVSPVKVPRRDMPQ